MWWISRLIEGYVDVVCSTVNESVKTVLHEVWSLSAQVVNGTSVVLLGFLHKPGFESHLEHRKRIKKRGTAPAGARRKSTFAQLVDETDDGDKTSRDESVGEDKPVETVPLDSPKLAGKPTLRERINSRRKNNRGKGLKHTNSVSTIQNLNDLAHYHEHITTGLLEDLFTNTLVFIDRCFMRIRLLVRSFLEAITLSRISSVVWLLPSVLNPVNWFNKTLGIFQNVKRVPQKMVYSDQLDVRCVKDIIEQAGYPYERHKVVTEDGYILLLERIPNKASKHVLYMQHGIFDSAFAWVGLGTAALAYRSHDQGYDVWLGNFRGNGDREHVRKNITEAEYWDFSINEHAFKDYPAFINHINRIKRQEFAAEVKPHNPIPKTVPVTLTESAISNLSSSMSSLSLRVYYNPITPGSPASPKKGKGPLSKEEINNNKERSERGKEKGEKGDGSSNKVEDLNAETPFRLSVVSHSMGACATLMYIIQCRMQNIPHHLSQAILLSPAGYHKNVPLICDIMGPLINLWLYLVPNFHVFRFPSDSARIWTAKAVHTVMNSPALSTLAAYTLSRGLFGGNVTEFPFLKVHNIAYNSFTGTAVKIYRHFWQMYKAGKFQAYDYGEARNRQVYGQPKPIDFLENYDVIDIPIHYCIGLSDNLITPSNVIHQYNVLRELHPELAFLKASKNGHLEFTLGLDEPLLEYIMEALELDKK